MTKNFRVWPSELFPGVKTYLREIVKNDILITPHRGLEFQKIYRDTINNFKAFFEIPDNYKVFFTYSATDWMDILVNWVIDEKITHIVNGTFWNLFVNASKYIWKEITLLEKEGNNRVPLDKINANPEVLAITANETSTWIEYSNEELKAVREQNLDSLILVDATSSFWGLKYDITSWDAWLFSVQKCLGLPSGLWILVLNDRCLTVANARKEAGKFIWGHNSLVNLDAFDGNNFTVATPNMMLIMTLNFLVWEFKDMFKFVDLIDFTTKEKADYFYDAILNIDWVKPYCEWEWKSKTTFVLECEENKMRKIMDKVWKNDYKISPWLFELEWKVIRIANFPAHTSEDLEAFVDDILK